MRRDSDKATLRRCYSEIPYNGNSSSRCMGEEKLAEEKEPQCKHMEA